MDAESNHAVVATVQAVWMYSTAAAFALFLVAIFILWGFRTRMKRRGLLLWIAVIVVLPIVGPVLWIALGRRRYPAKLEESFAKPLGTQRLD